MIQITVCDPPNQMALPLPPSVVPHHWALIKILINIPGLCRLEGP